MDVTVRVESPEADSELQELYDWLRTERELRGRARMNLTASVPGRDEMGGTLDVIQIVVGHGIALSSLAVSISQWRESKRAAKPNVVIERNGTQISFQDVPLEDVKKLLETEDEEDA